MDKKQSPHEALELKLSELKEDMTIIGSVLAHDIRTPLKNMEEYIKQLHSLHRRSKDKETRELISLLMDEITRIQGSFNVLLEYSRISNSKIKPKAVQTSEILNNILINHSEEIHEVGAIITHDNLPAIDGSRVYLSHIFSHLLSNAIKYRNPDKTLKIHFGCRLKSDGLAEFYCQDNGIGVAEEFQKIIFVLFQRLHTAEEIPGVGAGLAICKKIVELHGGQIRLESNQGEGSTIYFTLPTASLNENDIKNTTDIEEIANDIINVLLVEDMKSDADALQQVLAHNNLNSDLHITTESRLEQGLSHIDHNKTDVVFLDLGLPDVKGIEVIDMVRKKHPTLPIIVFSGNSDKETITQALQHGANQFLVKGECSGMTLKNSIYQAIAASQLNM